MRKYLRNAWQFMRHASPIEMKASNKPADWLILRARALIKAGNPEMAIALFEQAVALEPTFAEALEQQAELLDIAGQRVHSTQLYESARKLRAAIRPGAPDRHFVLRNRGQFTGEILAYDAVLYSMKKSTLPYVARGNAYLATRRPEIALFNYDRALKLKPKLPAVTILRAEALSMQGHYLEALKAFDAALAVQRDDAEGLSGRAIARIALGRVSEANADWRRQFQLLGSRAAARACVALRLADYSLALPQLDNALLNQPTDAYWNLYRLAAQRRLGIPVLSIGIAAVDAWPGPLLALHLGRISEDEVLKRADTAERRAEAVFQIGVLSYAADRKVAERRFREVVDNAAPSLIEYAAARNELSRLASSHA